MNNIKHPRRHEKDLSLTIPFTDELEIGLLVRSMCW
jgi:hypothetical protein